MRTFEPPQQERHKAAGLVLLLAAVVAGVVLQIVLVPREAQAVRSARLASAEEQVAAFGPPAPASPRSSHDFLQPRTRPSRLRPATRSRLGPAQPTFDGASRAPAATASRTPASPRGKLGELPATPHHGPAPAVRLSAPPNHSNPMPRPADHETVANLEPARPSEQGPIHAEEARTESAEPEGGAESVGDPRDPAVRGSQDRAEARMAVLGPADAREGELVTFAVSVDGVRELAHSPVRLTFDPQVLEFVEAQEGPMLSSDGAATRFQVGHGGGEGVIDVLVSRTQPGRGLTGSGVLFSVTFLAHAPGETPILTSGSSLLDGSGRRITFLGEDTGLSVRP